MTDVPPVLLGEAEVHGELGGEGYTYSIPPVTRSHTSSSFRLLNERGGNASIAGVRVVRVLLRLLVPQGQDEAAKDLEIVVLRHEGNVLRRQIKRPRFRPSDRAFLAAAARRLPRARWGAFLVTPKMLPRWHRELVRLGNKGPFRSRDASAAVAVAAERPNAPHYLGGWGRERPAWVALQAFRLAVRTFGIVPPRSHLVGAHVGARDLVGDAVDLGLGESLP